MLYSTLSNNALFLCALSYCTLPNCALSNCPLSNFALSYCIISDRHLLNCTSSNCIMLDRAPLTTPKVYYHTFIVLSLLAFTHSKYFSLASHFHNLLECLYQHVFPVKSFSLSVFIYIYIYIYTYILPSYKQL